MLTGHDQDQIRLGNLVAGEAVRLVVTDVDPAFGHGGNGVLAGRPAASAHTPADRTWWRA